MAKLNEADLVNATHKERLSPKNSEPSQLKSGSWDVLGGPTWDNKGGAEVYKIDAAKGRTTDTTIPKSVGPEATHLTQTEDTDEPELSFGDDEVGADVDDLDRELDDFESTDPISVDVALAGDDDEDDFTKEDTDAPEAAADAKDKEKDDTLKEEDDDENPFAKKDDKDDLEEGEQPPWLKKDGDKDLEEGGQPPWLKKDGDEKDDDEKDLEEAGLANFGDKKAKPFSEEDDSENPFAKKDDDEKEKVEEALKIRIKLPQAKLFESANMSAKTQKKVGVVFEAAIRETTRQVASQVHAHYKKLHESRIAKRDAVMAKQMDSYLSYVVEEWVKANKVTIRQSLRAQMAEEFMGALKKVFVEHYIDVPESKVDVVAKLTEDVQKLRRFLNVEHAAKLKLRRLAEAANKARIVAESSRGMSVASCAKLQKLSEDTPYTSAKDFREKVGLLKESYFPKAAAELKRLPDDDVQEQVVQNSKHVSADPDINAIAQSLSRQANAARY